MYVIIVFIRKYVHTWSDHMIRTPFEYGALKFQFLDSHCILNVLQDLDETHLFITQEVLELLQEKIDDLMDKISVPVVEGRAADSK